MSQQELYRFWTGHCYIGKGVRDGKKEKKRRGRGTILFFFFFFFDSVYCHKYEGYRHIQYNYIYTSLPTLGQTN